VARAEDEALVLGERHLGVLRMGLRREEGAAPPELAARHPLPAALRELLRRREQPLVPLGIDSAQRPRVRVAPDGDDRVDLLELRLRNRRDEVQLLVAAFREQQLGQPLGLDVQVRVRVGGERGPVELDGEWRRHGRRVYAHHLPGLEAERVVDDQVGEPPESLVSHQRTRKARLTKTVARLGFIERSSGSRRRTAGLQLASPEDDETALRLDRALDVEQRPRPPFASRLPRTALRGPALKTRPGSRPARRRRP
jgi:hypothetical protein